MFHHFLTRHLIAHKPLLLLSGGLCLLLGGCSPAENPLANAPQYPIKESVLHDVVKKYCVDCHNADEYEGDLDLASIVDGTLNDNPYAWQDVAWALQSQEMPPKDEPDVPRPDAETYAAAFTWLDTRIGGHSQSEALLADAHPEKYLVEHFCLGCHNATDKKGDLVLADIMNADIASHPEIWEEVIRKLDARQMPPANRKRPNEAAYQHLVTHLSQKLDALAEKNTQPGNTESFRRLTRTEYQNAIRDLFALNIDAARFLPAEQQSHGFDNITVSNLSPTLLDRYISAAQKIARLAVGDPTQKPEGYNYRSRPDQTQEDYVPGLPLGTRGGMHITHYFPVSGEYRVTVRLSRDRDEHIEGFTEEQQLEILLNGELKQHFTLVPPKGNKEYAFDESQLFSQFQVTAGEHNVGVTFPQLDGSLMTTKRQPFQAAFNLFRHPRQHLAIYEVSITGPFSSEHLPTAPISQSAQQKESPSRERIFSCKPNATLTAETCAAIILDNLATLAYRRTLTADDKNNLMTFYQQAAAEKGFEAGIENALGAMLVNPHFLFRIETGSPNDSQSSSEKIALKSYELASRLSFFIWNSLPDAELLQVAATDQLQDPEILKQQAQRMLADKKAESMIRNFTEQWLYLRNLQNTVPDARQFPDFDNNLRSAMAEETLLFVQSIFQSERSVIDLVDANFSFLNERLAKHYAIPQVYGSRFRKVDFTPEQHRGGLLRHASVLTITSYATRTSPVVRGNWILENFIGTPTPPPPPNIPALENDVIAESLPVRLRLNKHREDPSCAGCHDLMDPIGFALENYDAIGRWRMQELGHAVDASAGLPDGSRFVGAQGLVDGMRARPDLFAKTLTEKLMVFALGRGLEYYDAPNVRAVVRAAATQNYSFASLVANMVQIPSFRYKMNDDNKNKLMAQENSH